MEILERAKSEFQRAFGGAPTAAGVAPGRVEVLGNHTDYNEGFILAAAIDRHVVVCGRAIAGDTARVVSADFGRKAEFSVSAPQAQKAEFWVNYCAGVCQALAARGIKCGAFEAVVLGDVPQGSGLSSSAALEVATAHFLRELYPFKLTPVEIALTCQQAENKFVGVNCGILDQFSSTMGRADQLVYLDCRDLAKYDHFPLGTEVELVLANTKAKHELADGTYNRLREDCFAAARYFATKLTKKVTHLRDVTPEDFAAHAAGLPETTRKRAKHIVTENARVQTGVAALRRGDLADMGGQMLGSHCSSRDDFGNSCAELDAMVECARDLPGCYGCRLSGGGFGGCTVNLVAADQAKEFATRLAERYQQRTGIKPELHICRAVDGARGLVCK